MKIGRDKWKHFFVGFILAFCIHLLLHFFSNVPLPYNITFNLIIIFAIAYGFELFSKYSGHGHYEMKDVWATLLGAVAAILISAYIL